MPAAEITRLLRAAAQGEPQAAEQLFPVIYGQLRALAQNYMQGERADHTLQATALVHEAYLRLVQNEHIDWTGRAHFYVAAADAMRRVLIDHARQRGAQKRGADWDQVTLNLSDLAAGRGLDELLAVDEALEELAAADSRTAQVVRLRFFVGLSIDDTARALGLSPRSVDREWQYARAWLKKRLSASDAAGHI
ncbi:MAG TPA: sigma-70 family RNA polymerase sigma factor [Phycisphaerae bacterium]